MFFQPLNPPIQSFQGQRIWLVGASTGIGAALAEQLIAAGARVAVSARSADSLAQQFSGRAEILPLDVTDATALNLGAQTLCTHWGGLDLVLAIAGTYQVMRADRVDLAAAKRILDINLSGVLNLFAAVQPTLLKQGHGGFGIVSSVAGYGGLPLSLAYGASKAACINLAQSLWLDLHDKGIGIYLINPGFVRTPLTANNPFPMPFLIDADVAAQAIMRGLQRGAFEIHFPKTFSRLLKLLNLLPHWLYLRLVKRGTGL